MTLSPAARRDWAKLSDDDRAYVFARMTHSPVVGGAAGQAPDIPVEPTTDIASQVLRTPENLALGARSGVAHLAHAGRNVASLADRASGAISAATGLRKGGAFGDIANDLGEAEQALKPTEAEQASGGEGVLDKTARTTGEMAPTLPIYAAGPVAAGVYGATEAADQGIEAAAVAGLKSALTAKAWEVGGTIPEGLGHYMGVTPKPWMKAVGSAIMGMGNAAAEGGDTSDVLAGGLSAAALHAPDLAGHLQAYPEFVKSAAKSFGNTISPHLPELYEAAHRITQSPLALHALIQEGLHDPTGMQTLAAVLAGHVKAKPKPKVVPNTYTPEPQRAPGEPKIPPTIMADPKTIAKALKFRQGMTPEERVQALVNSKHPWAILTATREAVGDPNAPENIGGNQTLLAELVADGYKPLPLNGSWEGNPQGVSYFVAGMHPYYAQYLGRKYHQQAVVAASMLAIACRK